MNIMNTLEERFKELKSLGKQIECLIQILYLLLWLIFGFMGLSVLTGKYDQLIDLFTPIIPLLAAVLFAKASNRIIIDNDINMIDKIRYEIAQVTHYQVTIADDIRTRFQFLKNMLEEEENEEKKISIIALVEICKTIEYRYEQLLKDKDSFKYLSFECSEILLSISGVIFRLRALVQGIEYSNRVNPSIHTTSLSKVNSLTTINKNVDKVLNEIKTYIDELHKLRNSVADKNTEKSLQQNQP